MGLQVLISTMNQKDYSLLDKMNIQTDAIVINQCDYYDVSEFVYKDHIVKWISCAERGVGLSRNTAMMRATADILLFADDDVIFADGYEKLVLDEFNKNTDASLIVFNIKCLNEGRFEKETDKTHRIHFYSSLSYGAYRFAVKRNQLIHNRIYFSELFGGGAKYSAGEDNIFLNDCLKHRLICKASNVNIGIVTHNDSTWFEGFNEKYFVDLGHLMYSVFKQNAILLTTVMLFKNRNIYKFKSFKSTWKLIRQGIHDERMISRGYKADD